MSRSITDVLVLGSGIAGLSAALGAARKGASVTIATKATRPEGASTWWAQGGIAVSRKEPEQFQRDIIAASSETSDPDAVEVLVQHADAAVRDVLIDTLDIGFDTGGNGAAFDYGREAAHSADRILHVDASTGKHIHIPFLNYLADHERVEIRDDTAALELLREGESVTGALLESDGTAGPWTAGTTIVATGGIGALYGQSTNPRGATGDGVAMAIRAGAAVDDLEYVQFHPTVCVESGDPFLVSEAVRGEGALLRNANGERFMPAYHEDAELAPRDVVARAVEQEHEETGQVVLDVSPLDFASTFPDLMSLCEDNGVDPSTGIPVVPAEHFLCGGIDVDTWGRTTLDRLFAVGECARTGVHGANRLASTSLLEGLVWGLRAGEAAANGSVSSPDSSTMVETGPGPSPEVLQSAVRRIRDVMDTHVSLRRTAGGLETAAATLQEVAADLDAAVTPPVSRAASEVRSACTVGLRIAEAARANDRSIGCHYRSDVPAEVPAATDADA
ncbi:aspartate oxidase [Salinibacter sp. 10B]|uniref:L-aspartate oxidase n=1 Tax=Salinibacter sp. 10B TaxID=1923971 RepID=UPI000CF43EEB|nr:FAD-dependent oxidoreductase [Salinibacter sp. 10B]PQJ36294.1 aspartate oxidase [Salinibacter sp. 10B]